MDVVVKERAVFVGTMFCELLQERIVCFSKDIDAKLDKKEISDSDEGVDISDSGVDSLSFSEASVVVSEYVSGESAGSEAAVEEFFDGLEKW